MMGYVCKNCGFKFRKPVTIYREKPLNPGRIYAIDPSALFYPIEVCPKCGSNLIERVVTN